MKARKSKEAELTALKQKRNERNAQRGNSKAGKLEENENSAVDDPAAASQGDKFEEQGSASGNRKSAAVERERDPSGRSYNEGAAPNRTQSEQ